MSGCRECIPYPCDSPKIFSVFFFAAFGAQTFFVPFWSPSKQIFDPLSLSDGAAPGDIKKWREAEIKHGRVAMLAALGVLVAEVRLSRSLSCVCFSATSPPTFQRDVARHLSHFFGQRLALFFHDLGIPPAHLADVFSLCPLQEYHPFFMGPDYIGPAVDHFQEITAQYPEVRHKGQERTTLWFFGGWFSSLHDRGLLR